MCNCHNKFYQFFPNLWNYILTTEIPQHIAAFCELIQIAFSNVKSFWELTYPPQSDELLILHKWSSSSCWWYVSERWIRPRMNATRPPLMISQQWFGWYLGALRQQTITWANVDHNPCRHMASFGHNELIQIVLRNAKALYANHYWITALCIRGNHNKFTKLMYYRQRRQGGYNAYTFTS